MKRNGLIREMRMVDEHGNKYCVQEYATVVNHRDLSGDIAARTETRILRTTTGLHVYFDGLSYSLPERNGMLLFPEGEPNG